MKKALLFLAATAATGGAFAQGWQKPVYSGAFQPLTPGDTVYIYNTEAQQFLTEGNDWGTHGTVGETGLLFVVNPYIEEEKEWDGQTYTIRDYSIGKGGWYDLFINAEGIYVDRGTQEDYFFSFKDLGNNTYQIYGAAINPTFNATGDMADYMLGRYTDYTNTRDGIWTGTGVIYDYYGIDHNYGEGQFQAVWTFVSQADYAGYQTEMERYQTAAELKEVLDKAEAIGVPGIDSEKATYANTASTTEALQEAIASVNKKTLAYYEVYVTPDTPMDIDADECNAITAWTNGINATTWNTQSWIGDGWEGFEGTTLNIWGASMSGKAYKQFTDLPNGIYVVSLAVYSEKLDGYVFANDNKKSVAGAAAGNVYTVTTEVTDGTLEVGFGQDVEGTNWVAIDNENVKYYGLGVEAYRFWLNGLLESAPNFDNAVAQDSLVEAYNAVLASVNTATTKDEILAIIPQYEAILNEIGLNIATYEALQAAINAAETMNTTEGINLYYGDLLGDAVQAKNEIVEEHKLNTEAVQAATAELTALTDEAQNYLWKMESLTNEMATAATIYEEFKDVCAPSAVEAYNTFVEKYNTLDTSNLTYQNVLDLLDELYTIEFNLQVPDQPASDENPVDYTAKIQYPSFDGGATGWTNDGWSTCGTNDWNSFADGEVIDQLYLNLWHTSNARVYQTLTGLPAGTYILQMSAFADAEGLQVYANNDSMDVIVGQNNEEGSEYYGIARIFGETTEPLAGTVWYGNIYQITTLVGEDGILEIGARNVGGGTIWAMIDNAKLTYYGTASSKIPTDITTMTVRPTPSDSRTYNIAGQAVCDTYKGIVIKNGKKYWQK